MKKILTCLMVLFLGLTLVACGSTEEKTYKVIFDTDGGSSIQALELKAGAEIKLPADPVKEGYTFGGWYTDIDLTDEFELSQVMASQSITLYAKWVVTLTFDSAGGSAVAPIVGAAGSVFNLPQNPTYGKNVFIGWFYDDGTKLTYVMPRHNTTVHARWEVLELGSAIMINNEWLINDEGSYIVSAVEGGQKITATSAKGEWSYIYSVINGDVKQNRTVVADLIGKEGVTAVLKLEGGNAEQAAEISVTFTGEEQRIVWTVEEKNLTSIGGQKFLIFVNGGTIGASEDPEYMIVKEIGLYRTIAEGEAQRSTISFMSNGGSLVETYYLEPGTLVSAPVDPVKEGFIFTGWYQDAELTTPYEFSVMPERAIVVYAGWRLENEYLPDCNLLGGEFQALDEGTYEITNNEDSYVLKKTENGGEWNCMVLSMAGKKLTGYNLLRLTIKGAKGEQIMFKINDSNVGERVVTCTGEVQHIELPFNFDLDPSKALVVFLKPGLSGASEEFTITELAYGNYTRYANLLVDGWYDNDGDDTYAFSFEDGALTFHKESTEGKEWSVLCIKLEDLNLTGFDQVKFAVKGTEGEQIIVKINDQGGACEQWVTLNGEVQEFTINLPKTFEHNQQTHTVVLFANPGALGTGHDVVLSKLEAFRDEEEVQEVNPVEPLTGTIDLLDVDVNNLGNLGEGFYEVSLEDGVLTITKKATGGDWNCLIFPARPELNGQKIAKLVINFKGTAGERILFKLNDSREFWQDATGEDQVVEVTLDFTIDGAKGIMVVFANGGASGTGNPFVISKMEIELKEQEPKPEPTDEARDVDLMGGEFTPLDQGTYEIQNNEDSYILKKTENGGEWNCMVLSMNGKELEGLNLLRVELQGPSGEQILFKINDEGAGEKYVTCTGEVQYLELSFNLNLDPSKALVVFLKPGAAGASGEFKITRLEYANHSKYLNLLASDFMQDNAGHVYAQDGGEMTFAKYGGEWDCIYLPADETLDGATVKALLVQIEGPEGEQVLFKLNDNGAFEKWVTCDGTLQSFAFELEGTIMSANKLMVLFANAGATGTGHEFVLKELTLILG